jgi:hypothetical protein
MRDGVVVSRRDGGGDDPYQPLPSDREQTAQRSTPTRQNTARAHTHKEGGGKEEGGWRGLGNEGAAGKRVRQEGGRDGEGEGEREGRRDGEDAGKPQSVCGYLCA